MPNPTEGGQKKVFLVDDHPLVREHLSALLGREPDLTVCGEAEDGPSALAQIPKAVPDLVIMDITLRNSHGLELLKDLRALCPSLPILVLSMHDESLYAERVVRAGALGYINKQEASRNILSAVRKVLAGEVYVSERMAGLLMKKMVGAPNVPATALEELSDRELEIFQMIGQGIGTRRIAEDLKIGIKTVESYRARIKEKLGLADGDELLQHAIEWSRRHPLQK